MRRFAAVVPSILLAVVVAGCGSAHARQPRHSAVTHSPKPSPTRTTDPVAVGACQKVDAAVASIPPNPERIQVEVAGQPIQAAADSVAGIVPLGKDLSQLAADMSHVIADSSITSDRLNTDLATVQTDCSNAGYVLHHDSIS